MRRLPRARIVPRRICDTLNCHVLDVQHDPQGPVAAPVFVHSIVVHDRSLSGLANPFLVSAAQLDKFIFERAKFAALRFEDAGQTLCAVKTATFKQSSRKYAPILSVWIRVQSQTSIHQSACLSVQISTHHVLKGRSVPNEYSCGDRAQRIRTVNQHGCYCPTSPPLD